MKSGTTNGSGLWSWLWPSHSQAATSKMKRHMPQKTAWCFTATITSYYNVLHHSPIPDPFGVLERQKVHNPGSTGKGAMPPFEADFPSSIPCGLTLRASVGHPSELSMRGVAGILTAVLWQRQGANRLTVKTKRVLMTCGLVGNPS